MKKLSSVFLCTVLTVIGVGYCRGVDAEESVNIDESLFSGIYLGGGIGYNYVRYDSYRLSTNVGFCIMSPIHIGVVHKYDQQKINRSVGCLLLGGGTTFCRNFYVGFEGLVDFSKSKTESVLIQGKEYLEVAHDSDGGYVMHKGGAKQIGGRLGYVIPDLGAMIYLRSGIAFLGRTELWGDGRRTMTGPDFPLEGRPKKTSFAFALGIEKTLCYGFSARLEGERVHQRPFETTSFAAHSGDTGWRTKASTKEYNVRLLVTYTLPL
jgi:hypothetical protein